MKEEFGWTKGIRVYLNEGLLQKAKRKQNPNKNSKSKKSTWLIPIRNLPEIIQVEYLQWGTSLMWPNTITKIILVTLTRGRSFNFMIEIIHYLNVSYLQTNDGLGPLSGCFVHLNYT